MRKAGTHCRAQGTGPSAPNCGRRAAPESGKAQKRPNRLRLPPSPTVPVGPVPGPLGGSGRGLTRCSLSPSAWAYMMADFQVGSTTSWRLRGHPKLQMFGVDSPQTWVIESDTYYYYFFFTACRHSCPKAAHLRSFSLFRLESTPSSDSSNLLAASPSIPALGKTQESPPPTCMRKRGDGDSGL